jgi:hypothetical protein
MLNFEIRHFRPSPHFFVRQWPMHCVVSVVELLTRNPRFESHVYALLVECAIDLQWLR